MNIPQQIDEYYKNLADDRESYIGASQIGHSCERRVYLESTGASKEKIPGRVRRLFEFGKMMEVYFIEYLENIGIKTSKLEEVSHTTYPSFKGTGDAKGTHKEYGEFLIEFKTLNAASFTKFKKGGIIDANYQYYTQIQVYMGLYNLKKCLFMALNKNNHELHVEWVNFNPGPYQVACDTARYISECEEPPKRLSDSPLYYICRLCPFTKHCF